MNASNFTDIFDRNRGSITMITSFLLKTIQPPICIMGMIGIIITVIILSKKQMHNSTNCYLVALAMTDFFCLLILSTRSLFSLFSSKYFEILYIYNSYMEILFSAFILLSAWMTVLVAVERYIAICHPYHALSMCTIKRAKYTILVTVLTIFILQIPNFLKYKLIEANSIIANKTGVVLTHTDLGRNIEFIKAYACFVDGFCAAILPTILLLTLTIRLIYEINKSTRYLQSQMAANSKLHRALSTEQIKVNSMVIGVVLLFIVCQTPCSILTFIFSYLIPNSPTLLLFLTISLLLMTLKSSINFVLYCWFSEKFWITFKRLFCMCWQSTVAHTDSREDSKSVPKTSFQTTKETNC